MFNAYNGICATLLSNLIYSLYSFIAKKFPQLAKCVYPTLRLEDDSGQLRVSGYGAPMSEGSITSTCTRPQSSAMLR